MLRVTKTKTALALVVAAAIAAPSASARPIDYPIPAGTNAALGPATADDRTSGAGGADAAVVRTVEVPSSGFDWGDVAVGAAGMLSLLGLGAGAVVIVRRSRRSQPAIG